MLADAKTGAILASANAPSFDPNKKNITSYLDRNIASAFEPGSTMKIFSYMAAMEHGIYNGEEKYKSGIFTAKDGTQIGDWYRKGWGNITYDQGFALSSNVAVMNLIDKYMDANILKAYYRKLGFGSKTGIELPNEVSGRLEFKYETEVLNAGFGQGITTTSIQNIKALTAISNNGILLKPYIIDKIVDSNTGEIVYQGHKTEIERVASEETVAKIKELMRSVITGNSSTSTGYYYYMDGYDFIAKTGTAQVANQYGTGYTDGIIRGLAGMFPGDNPEVILYLAIKNPTNGTGPTKRLVQEIIKNVSKYLEIYDETSINTSKLETIEVESYVNRKKDDVATTLNSKGIETIVIGDGDIVVNQYPKKGEKINKLDKIFLVTNYEKLIIPNLIGYSAKDFYTYMSLVDIPYTTTGIGFVETQSIPANTQITGEETLEIEFKTKY
jgi:penicillin-binding protein 2B